MYVDAKNRKQSVGTVLRFDWAIPAWSKVESAPTSAQAEVDGAMADVPLDSLGIFRAERVETEGGVGLCIRQMFVEVERGDTKIKEPQIGGELVNFPVEMFSHPRSASGGIKMDIALPSAFSVVVENTTDKPIALVLAIHGRSLITPKFVIMGTEIEISEQEASEHGKASDGRGMYLLRRKLRMTDGEGAPQEFYYDTAHRAAGMDAVAVIAYRIASHRTVDRIEVLLRKCLRPNLPLDRVGDAPAMPDCNDMTLVIECVAGKIEPGENGKHATITRALEELFEEAGYRASEFAARFMGGTFPTPGMVSEKHFYVAVEVPFDEEPAIPKGDGSPLEEVAVNFWVNLDVALDMCRRGEIEDSKTEIGLRRLQEIL